jgi:hypothetical protein
MWRFGLDWHVVDPEPVSKPVVYAVMAIGQYVDSSNKLWGVFTSIEALSSAVNAIPGMRFEMIGDEPYIRWKHEDDTYYAVEIVPLDTVIPS